MRKRKHCFPCAKYKLLTTSCRACTFTLHHTLYYRLSVCIEACLVDHEFRKPLVQLAVGAAQNHLQHVSVHLLHHHIDLHNKQNLLFHGQVVGCK